MESAITHVQRSVDRLERFKCKGNLLLFAFIVQNCTDKDTKTVVRDSVVELEFLLGGSNGGKDGKSRK